MTQYISSPAAQGNASPHGSGSPHGNASLHGSGSLQGHASPHEHAPQLGHVATTRVVASSSSWIEGEAVRQLEAVAKWPGMEEAVGMPDLHPSKGTPNGAAFFSRGRLYPTLVGSDGGCGVGLWQTDIPVQGFKAEKAAKRLERIEGPWSGDPVAWLQARGVAPTGHDASLGTIGAGNHFVELLAPEDIDGTAGGGLSPDRLVLLVHSGSRGLGEAILRDHAAQFGAQGLDDTSEAARVFLAQHDHAVQWAAANRACIAHRVGEALGTDCTPILDVCHNGCTAHKGGWLHRKGAAPADCGPVVIPGSRGSYSYLVNPVASDLSLYSLAHGAGRKWRRSDAKGRLESRMSLSDLTHPKIGSTKAQSFVVCTDRALLYEEAPQAYKDIERVVGDLEEHGLVTRQHRLRPVLSFKTAKLDTTADRKHKAQRIRGPERAGKSQDARTHRRGGHGAYNHQTGDV